MADEKYDILKRYFGYDTFREGQEQVIDELISGRDVLGVMPTGAGKSSVSYTHLTLPTTERV